MWRAGASFFDPRLAHCTVSQLPFAAFAKQVQCLLLLVLNFFFGGGQVRRIKPVPQDEARAGRAVIEQVLWDAVPAYLRRLDGVLKETVGKTLPIQAAPVVFASWMGGDRCAPERLVVIPYDFFLSCFLFSSFVPCLICCWAVNFVQVVVFFDYLCCCILMAGSPVKDV